MNLRKTIFNIIKFRDYKYINSVKKNLRNNIEKPIQINEFNKEKFLEFITNNSVYYKQYKDKKIHDFPIITKREIVDNYNEIATIKPEKRKKLIKVSTSGSYGTPLSFYVTKEKRLTQQGEVLFFGSYSNFDLGIKHLYIRVIKPSFKNMIIKNQYILKPGNIDQNWMRKALKKISNEKHRVIITYPSIMNNLATYACEHQYEIKHIKGIITYGEKLDEKSSQNIYKAFNCKPLSRYSTEELGVLANTKIDSNEMILNQVNYYIEILDENNEPVAEGNTGKVVVTDFNSHIIPLVRYDTGDLATLISYKDGLAHTISNIEGRKIETVYTTRGDALMPFNINRMMSKIENIYQFQFIQKGRKEYDLKILPKKSFDESKLNELKNQYKNLLGEDALINIILVDKIETLKSGKRPYIINQYTQK